MKEVKEVVDTVSVALANGQPEEAGNVVMQEVNHALDVYKRQVPYSLQRTGYSISG